MRDHVSMREAARILEVSQLRVRELIRKGTLAASKLADDAGERWMIARGSVEAFMQRRGEASGGEDALLASLRIQLDKARQALDTAETIARRLRSVPPPAAPASGSNPAPAEASPQQPAEPEEQQPAEPRTREPSKEKPPPKAKAPPKTKKPKPDSVRVQPRDSSGGDMATALEAAGIKRSKRTAPRGSQFPAAPSF